MSHAGADRAWAEWVAWQLLDAGHQVELDYWDWGAGDTFVLKRGRRAGCCWRRSTARPGRMRSRPSLARVGCCGRLEPAARVCPAPCRWCGTRPPVTRLSPAATVS
ncbi:toll/interleukin-1 receptor domain-containing protein [Streptomyces sp. NPDC051001]|uniref:toll/interleukin-1 receptor domain-containing protein n=1 Tax=Streptomyces sp. NPDC051001 TaxID=3155795 RepID=UPI003444FD42